MLARYARDGRVPVAFLNLVGGNDELVFDGGSMVLDDRGRVGARAALFAEDLLVADVVRGADGRARVVPVSGGIPAAGGDDAGGEPLESLRRALVLGIRDYAQKCGFSAAVLGLSGGIDSALVAALAVEAFGSGERHRPRDALALLLRGLRRGRARSRREPRDPLRGPPDREALSRRAGLPRAHLRVASRGRRRGERPVAPARAPPDGLLERVRRARPHDREQERARGGLLHALRRHVRRPRADLGPPEDARLRARPAPQRARRAAP